MLLKYKKFLPKIGKNVFIAPGSYIIGNVNIGSKSNIWFNVVIRGDVEKIKIDSNTNIQDLTMIHCTTNGNGTQIGSNVTISEGVNIQTHSHGLNPRSKPIKMPLNIGNNVWIGANAIVLSSVNIIGENSGGIL